MLICFYRQFGSNFCQDEEKVQTWTNRSCSEFMWAVLEGYSLDRSKSGLDDKTDQELQMLINKWSRDPTGSPDCSFYKYVF